MVNISGQITTSSIEYSSVQNNFTIEHGIVGLSSAPSCISIMKTEGEFEEIFPSAIEFLNTSIVVYLGSLVLTADDVISYQFSVEESQ